MREAMAAKRVSQADIAQIAGLTSQSAVSNILKGKRRLKLEEADVIGRFLGIHEPQAPQIQFVPIIGMSAAGNWREAIELPGGRLPLPPDIAGPRSFAVEVRGDSMDRLIPDGGYVVVDPDKGELFNGRSYLLQNEDGETTVKCYRSDPARFEPVSSNPVHQPILVGEQRFKVLGRVVWRGAPA